MDVSALKLNSSVTRGTKLKKAKNRTQSFSANILGKATAAMNVQMQKDSSVLSKLLPKLIFVNNHEGEILNACVTFLGTALVAPLFIYYNPFVKDDKETREYSAWRQPISAVLALGTQVPINMVFNKYMKSLATEGKIEVADLRIKPHEDILKKEIKKEKGKISDSDLRIEIAKRQDEAFRNELNRLRQRVLSSEMTITDDMLINNDMVKELRSKIKQGSKDEIASLPRLKRNAFILEKAQGQATKETVEYTGKVAKILRKLVGLESNNAMKFSTVNEAIEYATERLEEYDKQYQLYEGNTKSPKFKFKETMVKIYNDVIENLKDIKSYEEAKNMSAFESIKSDGKFSFNAILNNVRLRQYLTSKVTNAETALKHNIKYWNIVVSAITLPFACMLLNWIYPIAMEHIMPEAYQKKKTQQQDTLVKTKKEVKA